MTCVFTCRIRNHDNNLSYLCLVVLVIKLFRGGFVIDDCRRQFVETSDDCRRQFTENRHFTFSP